MPILMISRPREKGKDLKLSIFYYALPSHIILIYTDAGENRLIAVELSTLVTSNCEHFRGFIVDGPSDTFSPDVLCAFMLNHQIQVLHTSALCANKKEVFLKRGYVLYPSI